MEKYCIHGGKRLTGNIEVSGAKNAAVAILPATILANGVFTIENVPDISDITAMVRILEELGAVCTRLSSSTLQIDTTYVKSKPLSNELTGCLRASYYFVGSLLGRFNYACVSTPGGCQFGGTRPMDMHIKGFQELGAAIPPADENPDSDTIIAKADKLIGAYIYLDKISVGATINIMLAAVRARGITVIENAAREPHIVDLANFLSLMGCKIKGAGTNTIRIEGCQDLHGTDYSIIPDQIEAGTYMVAAAATRGDLTICNVIPKHLDSITAKLRECGVRVEEFDDAVRVSAEGTLKPCHIKTQPHPGFPTDMQSQFAVLLCTCNGDSSVTESVWDKRFSYIQQLNRLKANIEVIGNIAYIHGVDELVGGDVIANDLRAGAAMVIAGLCAKGETRIGEIFHIDRGYENIVEKLRACGADISRITTEN